MHAATNMSGMAPALTSAVATAFRFFGMGHGQEPRDADGEPAIVDRRRFHARAIGKFTEQREYGMHSAVVAFELPQTSTGDESDAADRLFGARLMDSTCDDDIVAREGPGLFLVMLSQLDAAGASAWGRRFLAEEGRVSGKQSRRTFVGISDTRGASSIERVIAEARTGAKVAKARAAGMAHIEPGRASVSDRPANGVKAAIGFAA